MLHSVDATAAEAATMIASALHRKAEELWSHDGESEA